MKTFWAFILTLSYYLPSGAQPNMVARVDSTDMLMGDQQNLTITYTALTTQSNPDLHTEYLDTCSFLEIVSQTPWLKSAVDQQTVLEKKIRFTIFEAGQHTIPSLFAVTGQDTLHSYPIPLIIHGIEPDSSGLLPIKGIIKEKNKWTDYLVYIIGSAILLMIYAGYRYYQYRKLRKMDVPVEALPVILPPHEIALQKLFALKESRIWEKGEIKEYHVQLTFILREYLEHRYLIPALESTSHEILSDLRTVSIDEHIPAIDEILNIADWVKFARGIPEETVNAVALDKAINLVESTKPIIVPENTTIA